MDYRRPGGAAGKSQAICANAPTTLRTATRPNLSATGANLELLGQLLVSLQGRGLFLCPPVTGLRFGFWRRLRFVQRSNDDFAVGPRTPRHVLVNVFGWTRTQAIPGNRSSWRRRIAAASRRATTRERDRGDNCKPAVDCHTSAPVNHLTPYATVNDLASGGPSAWTDELGRISIGRLVGRSRRPHGNFQCDFLPRHHPQHFCLRLKPLQCLRLDRRDVIKDAADLMVRCLGRKSQPASFSFIDWPAATQLQSNCHLAGIHRACRKSGSWRRRIGDANAWTRY